MHTFHQKNLIIFSILLNGLSTWSQRPAALQVGSPAPCLEISYWLKGQPCLSFQKGKIYLLEMGSLTCGPCRAAVPHLSSLAKKYAGKVNVISVFVYENGSDTIHTDYLEKVRRYVKQLGSKIAYTVAVDNPKQSLASTWIEGSGTEGVPACWIIDQNGIIAWMGQPIGLEPIIDQIIHSDFNYAEALEKEEGQKASYRKIDACRRSGNMDQALQEINHLIQQHSDQLFFRYDKFDLLLDTLEEKAYDYARYLMKGPCRTSEPILFYVARDLLLHEEKLKHPNWKLAFILLNRALHYSESEIVSAYILDMKAFGYYKKKEKGKAIFYQQQAIQLLESHKDLLEAGSFYDRLSFYKSLPFLNSPEKMRVQDIPK
ncbi:MAG: TlpA family protein disulfide reductase [Flavisolibacter sp.]